MSIECFLNKGTIYFHFSLPGEEKTYASGSVKEQKETKK